MIVPGDVIFHEGTATRDVTMRQFVILVVAATLQTSDDMCLLWNGKCVMRNRRNVMGWLTNGMGYRLLRNGRPVTVVTNVV